MFCHERATVCYGQNIETADLFVSHLKSLFCPETIFYLQYFALSIVIAVTMATLICQHSTSVLSYSLIVCFDSFKPLAVFWHLACTVRGKEMGRNMWSVLTYFCLFLYLFLLLETSTPPQKKTTIKLMNCFYCLLSWTNKFEQLADTESVCLKGIVRHTEIQLHLNTSRGWWENQHHSCFVF